MWLRLVLEFEGMNGRQRKVVRGGRLWALILVVQTNLFKFNVFLFKYQEAWGKRLDGNLHKKRDR